MEELIIRPYRQEDRPRVREIAWETALMGEPADAFFEGRELFADFLTASFLECEPESCFVAEENGRVCGYLLGTKDSAVLYRCFRSRILPSLLWRAISGGAFLKKKNLIFLAKCLKAILAGEFKMPDFYRAYPATLHINLQRQARGKGGGSKLIAAFFDYLSNFNVPGVYVATMSERGALFFAKQGFGLLHKGKRSYFSHILQGDVPLYIYAKKVYPVRDRLL